MAATEMQTPGGEGQEHGGRLRPDAIGLKDAIVIGMASSGPTASIALTLAAIVAAASYAAPLTILICFVPMLGIALAYRRLNRWHVNCGATYVWAGRAITPYLGFVVGWIMVLGYFLGTISDVLPIGPYVLQVIAPSHANSNVGAGISASIWLVVVAVIAYVGIHATARLQWVFATVEYSVIAIFAVVALIAVFGGSSSAVAFDWNWFSWSTLGGTTGLVNGILIAVYMFSGWDSSVYVNEETQNARQNPGRAAIVSVVTLGIMYTVLTFAYQGAVKGKTLQAHGDNALAYIAKSLAGSPWDKVMILAVLLSIVGATQTAMVSGARIAFSMGADRTLPPALGTTHPRHRTPAVATLLFAALALAALWFYLLGSSSVQDSFSKVIGSVGLLFALFYAATGISVAVYYRRLATRGLSNLVQIALIPLASAVFLLWVAWKSIPGLGGWGGSILQYLYVMIALGLVLMLLARFGWRSDYFSRPVEAYEPDEHA